MTAKQRILSMTWWQRILTAAAPSALLGVVAFLILTGGTVISNSKKGADAYNQMKDIKNRQDSICTLMEQQKLGQLEINVKVVENIENIKEDISDIRATQREILGLIRK